jgi:uncharacterized protein (TIGR02118 family)
MIKLTCLLKRNPGLSPAEFEEHWRTTHADVIRSVPGIDRWLVRYVQRPVTSGDLTGSVGYDGVTEQWFASLDDFRAMIMDPEYRARVVPDERELLDMSSIVWVLTEEQRVIVDGEAD